MKKVIMPLSPQECERVFNGEQTILVRKRVPKIDTPYEVLAYETKGATDTPWVDEDGHFIYKGRGQVIGSFVCDKVDEYECHKGLTKFGGELGLPVGTIDTYFIFEDDYKAMCLSYDEVKAYGKGKILRVCISPNLSCSISRKNCRIIGCIMTNCTRGGKRIITFAVMIAQTRMERRQLIVVTRGIIL